MKGTIYVPLRLANIFAIILRLQLERYSRGHIQMNTGRHRRRKYYTLNIGPFCTRWAGTRDGIDHRSDIREQGILTERELSSGNMQQCCLINFKLNAASFDLANSASHIK